ncbi:MAG TPA: cupin domain-containing protein [Candidatus Limnocylindrales bacterium]|nr:cupin domain-containing protein [Candidatus Limnocylindrales bacterium]
MEIRRFGVGHRRAVGPAGTMGVDGVVLHSDARATISELAFARGGSVPVHDSPNSTWFIVIEGGGFVTVGEEERRVAAGEAVLWPAGLAHGARAGHGPMRAIVVEMAGADDSHVRAILEGIAKRLGPGEAGAAAKGEGRLAERPVTDEARAAEGEPS